VLQFFAVCCSAHRPLSQHLLTHMSQCGAECYVAVQCITVYCSALQCVAVYCIALQQTYQHPLPHHHPPPRTAVCCSLCVVVRCSVQCVRCSVLQCVAVCCQRPTNIRFLVALPCLCIVSVLQCAVYKLLCVVVCLLHYYQRPTNIRFLAALPGLCIVSVLQCAVYVLRCVAVCCNLLQCVAKDPPTSASSSPSPAATLSVCCSVLQCVAVYCSV